MRFFNNGKACNIVYGRNTYDYQEGTLVFIAPNQVVSIDYIDKNAKPGGLRLLFHPDLLHGTTLANVMKGYSFFAYQAHEALHVSEREKQMILDSFQKIAFELQQKIDKHNRKLIASNIELFLNY